MRSSTTKISIMVFTISMLTTKARTRMEKKMEMVNLKKKILDKMKLITKAW
jgi:hypothetical protein